MSDALYVDTDTGEIAIRRLNVGANKQYASYISYASNVLPPSADGLINGVSITALNKRTRTSGASAVDCVRTWTTRASPADIVWLSVCWAPELSLFAAVASTGTGNRVMTSPDGITWTLRTSAADNSWISVCWASELSLFVAVALTGAGNRVMTSPDGITWMTRTSAADNAWRSVCWAPELSLFVAVAVTGAGDRVMTSPDGITWTARTSSADNDWFSVCWAPELSLFTAVAQTGTGNRVMTSPDGITWTTRTSADDNDWKSVCWAPELSLFTAVAQTGTGNRVMTSPDGINWTVRTSAADNGWRSVCWAPELSTFAAVADSGTGNRVMTSAIGMPNAKSVVKALPSQMMVDANGNVGIGTTTPVAKLHVNGNLFIEGPISNTLYNSTFTKRAANTNLVFTVNVNKTVSAWYPGILTLMWANVDGNSANQNSNFRVVNFILYSPDGIALQTIQNVSFGTATVTMTADRSPANYDAITITVTSAGALKIGTLNITYYAGIQTIY